VCGYSVPRELLVTLPGLDCTAAVIFCVTGILSDGA